MLHPIRPLQIQAPLITSSLLQVMMGAATTTLAKSAAEDQTGEQYSKQGNFFLKELKSYNKTSRSAKILGDFISRPIFSAADDKMEQMCLSKVNLLSDNTNDFKRIT